ncbi:MAG: hypothetical protein WCW54_02460 [Candidatus Paceibacterota bacterium]
MKKELVLIITNFGCVENNVSYATKENDLKENLSLTEYRVRFFHCKFQSKILTLARILKEEKEEKMHVIFQKEIPIIKTQKIINRISEKIEAEKVTFSTTLV